MVGASSAATEVNDAVGAGAEPGEAAAAVAVTDVAAVVVVVVAAA